MSDQDNGDKPDEITRLKEQIDQLAKFIMAEVPGEPSQSEGAVDTAIRIMRAHLHSRAALRPRLHRILRRIDGLREVFAGTIETIADAELPSTITELDVVLAPEPDGSRLMFVECEVDGASIRAGKWITRSDGLRALRLRVVPDEIKS